MLQTRLATLLAAAACLSLAPALRAEQQAPVTAKVINGTPLPVVNSPVVAVVETNSDSFSLCTGSVIAPTAVLTAWHCVNRRASTMSVVVGGKTARVVKVRTDPHVRVDKRTGMVYDDVAILHLRRPVQVHSLGVLASRSVAPGSELAIYGYGLDERGRSGQLRGGFTNVTSVSSGIITTLFRNPNADACSGDSGGPAMYAWQDENGNLVSAIAGITSTGTSESCRIGDRTSFINLQSPTVLEFIKSQVPDVVLK